MKIDGNNIAQEILSEVASIANMVPKRICFIQFGDDAASTQFIARKERVAGQLGIEAHVIHESGVTTTEAALAVVEGAVKEGYDGIVVQLPLPFTMDTDAVLNAIPFEQDIDVLTKEGIDAFSRGQTERMPPVAGAIDAIITHEHIVLEYKNIVIVGKGKLVGQPIMQLFDRQGIAYTAVDVHTPEEEKLSLLKDADVVISGTGISHSITPSMIGDGVVLIDAGTSGRKGSLVGDIDPDCEQKATLFTPVPGGVGPITVALLFKNLFL